MKFLSLPSITNCHLHTNVQDAKVKVTRWFPGVLQNIVEEVKSQTNVQTKRGSVREMLAKEATMHLESKRNLQIAATQAKSLDEIKTEMGIPLDSKPDTVPEEEKTDTVVTFDTMQPKAQAAPPTTTRRRRRVTCPLPFLARGRLWSACGTRNTPPSDL